ncbi:DUF1120 domain-containing protein [Herbaspirillum robiniae]|nr:DUF1120 domain-containing protein [Herbaspirillum robiniae]
MKNILAFTALAASLISGAAVAGPSAELKVAGTIKPPACQPSFSGGGVADFGTIPSASLVVGQHKKLPWKNIPFSITCDAPIKVALKATDNRASSAVTSATGSDANFTYGLGTVAGKKVGGYHLGMAANAVTTDGATPRLLYSTDGNQSWTITDGGGQFAKDRALAWTGASGTMPAAFSNITGAIWIRVSLEKPENLPLTQDVPLDGSATLEVLYL